MSRILMFKAPWCGPCKVMGPIADDVCNSRNIELISINIDEEQEEAFKWSIRSVPTFVFVDQDDIEFYRTSGSMTKNEFEILVDNL